jgi:uncharacterized protein (TIGR03067 family)
MTPGLGTLHPPRSVSPGPDGSSRRAYGWCALGVIATTLGFLASAGVSRADDPAVVREMAELQGVWTLESMEVDGRKAPDDQTRGWMLVIEGDQYNPGSGLVSVEYTYKLDPGRNPKAIDLIPHEGTYKGRTLRGVYALKGDRLSLCRSRTPDGERPAGFGTRPDSGLVVSVWKRRKP